MLELTSNMRTEIIEGSKDDNGLPFDLPERFDFSAANDTDAWTLPAGATPPSMMLVYGNAPFGSTAPDLPGANFSDRVSLTATMRKAVRECASLHAADRHCDRTTAGRFAQGSVVQQIMFNSFSSRQVQTSRRFVLYRIGDAR